MSFLSPTGLQRLLNVEQGVSHHVWSAGGACLITTLSAWRGGKRERVAPQPDQKTVQGFNVTDRVHHERACGIPGREIGTRRAAHVSSCVRSSVVEC